jgi:hypothetical protein
MVNAVCHIHTHNSHSLSHPFLSPHTCKYCQESQGQSLGFANLYRLFIILRRERCWGARELCAGGAEAQVWQIEYVGEKGCSHHKGKHWRFLPATVAVEGLGVHRKKERERGCEGKGMLTLFSARISLHYEREMRGGRGRYLRKPQKRDPHATTMRYAKYESVLDAKRDLPSPCIKRDLITYVKETY